MRDKNIFLAAFIAVFVIIFLIGWIFTIAPAAAFVIANVLTIIILMAKNLSGYYQDLGNRWQARAKAQADYDKYFESREYHEIVAHNAEHERLAGIRLRN